MLLNLRTEEQEYSQSFRKGERTFWVILQTPNKAAAQRGGGKKKKSCHPQPPPHTLLDLTMAENKAEISPAETPDSAEYSPFAGTTAREISDTEQSETVREPKRRKNCPTALDNFQELAPSNRAFSFSFDTRIAVSSPEFTPKFGSFNLGLVAAPMPTPESEPLRNIPGSEGAVRENDAEEKEIKVSKEREGVGLLGLVDSINATD